MTPEQHVHLSRPEDEHEKKAIEDIRAYGMHWLDVFDRDHGDRVFVTVSDCGIRTMIPRS
jgi:hypothetical protein